MVYSALLFLHVAFVVTLFLTFGVEWSSLLSLRGTSSAEQVHRPATVLAGLGRLYGPSGAGIALTGVSLATIDHLWSQAWVLVALGVIVLLALDGALAGGPQVVALARRLQQTTGPLPADLRSRISGPELLNVVRIRVGATVGLLFLMIFNPGWVGSLAAVAVGVVAGWVSGRRSFAAGHRTGSDPVPRRRGRRLHDYQG